MKKMLALASKNAKGQIQFLIPTSVEPMNQCDFSKHSLNKLHLFNGLQLVGTHIWI